MLAQELIRDIKKPVIGGNVAIKLDMSKAYDRVSWTFTCCVLRQFGFDEIFIDLVLRTLSNNHYSVIINRTRYGYFKSSRGLKQGDPLAPALFIIGAELLSKRLNDLAAQPGYKGYFIERGPTITHLAFADDLIIFTSGSKLTLRNVMKILQHYEHISGQLINKSKSFFLTTPHAFHRTISRIQQLTSFAHKTGPITYLGCPVYYGTKRISYFSLIAEKVLNRIKGWQTKMLNFGGKVILVRHVLQSLPTYLMASCSPPKTTINLIEKHMANFFWGQDAGKMKYHWSSWKNLCKPYDEGGINIRSMVDVCTSFEYKNWWILRTKKTLWGNFMKAKYLQRSHIMSKGCCSSDSPIWKRLLKNRKLADPLIHWRINVGTSSFWWDNWLTSGSISSQLNTGRRYNSEIVAQVFNHGSAQVLNQGKWNLNRLRDRVPDNLVAEIVKLDMSSSNNLAYDEPFWSPTADGSFTCKTAWNELRDHSSLSFVDANTWQKQVPFKCSFLLWRALRNKLPTDDRLVHWGLRTSSSCVCCVPPTHENVQHIFCSGHLATRIWKLFAQPLGINPDQPCLRSLLIKFWTVKTKNDAQRLISKCLPIIICWHLWKNRCSKKYGHQSSSPLRTIFGIQDQIKMTLMVSYPYFQWPAHWLNTADILDKLRPTRSIIQVTWKPPETAGHKLNTDGSCLGNPGKIGGGGILRDSAGNLCFAFSLPLGNGTNNEAETAALLHGLTLCAEEGYHRIEVETDSSLLVDWIKGHNPPWKLKNTIQKIKNMYYIFEHLSFNHCFREGNKVADLLSKHSHSISTPFFTDMVHNLPVGIFAHIKFDQAGMVNFRRKDTKILTLPP